MSSTRASCRWPPSRSPVGPLDCLGARAPAAAGRGPGGRCSPAPSPHTDDGFTSYCIDQRGLVLLGPHERSVIVRYTSWRAGVDPGATELVPAEGGPDAAPVDPTGDYEGAPWGTWDGVYRDVRPATEAGRRGRARAHPDAQRDLVDRCGRPVGLHPVGHADHVRADFGERRRAASGPEPRALRALCRGRVPAHRSRRQGQPGRSPFTPAPRRSWSVARACAAATTTPHRLTRLVAPIGPQRDRRHAGGPRRGVLRPRRPSHRRPTSPDGPTSGGYRPADGRRPRRPDGSPTT